MDDMLKTPLDGNEFYMVEGFAQLAHNFGIKLFLNIFHFHLCHLKIIRK
jgi:hypothetical protein